MKWSDLRYDGITKDIAMYLATDVLAPLHLLETGEIDRTNMLFVPFSEVNLTEHQKNSVDLLVFNDDCLDPILKDIFHFIQSYTDAASKKHPLFPNFSSLLSKAFFVISKDSIEKARSALREKMGPDADHVPRSYFIRNRLVTRHIPKVGRFCQIYGRN